jgi:ATP-dependent DNA helicase RecG
VRDTLKAGESYVFYGKVSGTPLHLELTNPVFEREDGAGAVTGRIMPVYRLSAGISQNVMAKAVRQGLEACGEVLPDALPDAVRTKYQLAQARFAYENIHFPADFESLEIARRRLIFEELFVLSAALHLLKDRREKKAGLVLQPGDISSFTGALPFSLTGAQQRAIGEALSDMTGGAPMSRLIQETLAQVRQPSPPPAAFSPGIGYQSAVMAPTEILAEQHFKSFSELLSPLGLRVGLLTGSLTPKQKRQSMRNWLRAKLM